jgi:hypothetical protein
MRKCIYVDATGEVIGDGDENAELAPGASLADAPANYDDYPYYFWKWNGVDAIELKTGAELVAAQAQQAGQTVDHLIQKYAGPLVNPVTQGSMEEIVDLCVQLVHKLVNGTAITQAEKDAFNLIVTTCQGNYKLVLADVDQDVADGMNEKKAAARQAEIDMKNDPAWPV